MESAAQSGPARHRSRRAAQLYAPWQPLQWAAARVFFYGYLGVCILTLGLAGYLTAPLMSWYFYGDWRVWRHWQSAKGLHLHAYKMLWYVLQGRNGGFMLDVPLTAPPFSGVDPERVELRETWEFGTACGPCTRCCTKISCPILDTGSGLCGGYNSFFWRYFNCGRFPTEQREIDYYLCGKWSIKEPRRRRRVLPFTLGKRRDLVA